MMHKTKIIRLFFITLMLLCSTFFNLNAQTDIATGKSNFMVRKGTDLYISSQADSKIIKIDLSVTPPTQTDFVTTGVVPFGLAILDNDLYVSEVFGNRVVKINLSSKKQTDVITRLSYPYGLAFKGNELYVSEAGGTNRISKKDVTTAGTIPTTVVKEGLSLPYGLAFKGNDLYIAEYDSGEISKVDVTQTLPIRAMPFVSGLQRSDIYNLLIDGDYLYIALGEKSNKVSRINLTKSPLVVKDVFTGIGDGPSGMATYNDMIYIGTILDGSKVTEYPLPCPDSSAPVTKSGNTLSITPVNGATYQWVDCRANNAPIAGATSNSYTATANGNYAVEVTTSSRCTITSDCTAVYEVGKEVVATGFGDADALALKGSDLYVSDRTNKIYKIDLLTNKKTDFITTGLNNPNGIAINGNDLYVTQLLLNKVTKINLSSEKRTDVVTGVNGPYGLVFKGNDLYIGESVGSSILKKDITTAGTTATSVIAGISDIRGLAFKGNDLYASEFFNNKIVKVNLGVNPVTKDNNYAGQTLLAPHQLAIDGDYLYITTDINRIVRINLTKSPAVIENVITGLDRPRGVAIYNGFIYVTSRTQVLKYPLPCPTPYKPVVTKSLATLSTTAVAGATYQWLDCDNNNAPIAGATTTSYTATKKGNYALEITSSGGCKNVSECVAITEIPVVAGFTRLFGAVVKGNDLYVSDNNGRAIFKLDLSTNPVTKTTLKGGLGTPFGVAVLGNDIYYANNNAGTVSKINLTTKQETAVITGGLSSGSTFDLAFKGNELYVLTSKKVVKANVTGTLPITSPTDVMTGLSSFSNYGMAFRGNELYAISEKKIFKKDVTTGGTTPTEVFSGLNNPVSLVFDGDYLYISEEGTATPSTGKVSRIDVTASSIAKKDVKTGLSYPSGLAIYGDELYINVPKEIYKVKLPCPESYNPVVTKSGGLLSIPAVSRATYQWLDCNNNNAPIAGATNNSYAPLTAGNYAVEVKIGSNCKFTSACLKIVDIPVVGGFSRLFGGAVKGSDLYVSDNKSATSEIYKIDLSVSPITKTLFKEGLSNNYGVAILGDDLYYVDYKGGKISKVNITSKQQTDVITGGLVVNDIYGIAFHGNEIYISTSGKVLKADVTGTLPITSLVEVITGLGQNYGLAFHGNELYLSDVLSGKILKKDVTAASTTAIEVLSGLQNPIGLVFDGNYLYFAEVGSSKISRINLEVNPLVKKELVSEIPADGMVIYGDTLYIMANKKIHKIKIPCPDSPIVKKVGNTLSTAAVAGATYQWINCRNNSPILNATTTSYTPTANGNYAIEMKTERGCKVVSVCTEIAGIGREVVATGFTQAEALAIKGSDLYVSDATTNKISKIDLSVSSTTPINFVTTGLKSPRGLVIKDNDLYVAQWSDKKVTKINLSSKTPTDVITGLSGPYGINFKGNELYVTQSFSDKLVKKDVTTAGTTATNVVGGLRDNRGVAINGNDLYAGSFGSNTISKVNLAASPITRADYIAPDKLGPAQLLINGDYLYIAASTGRIVRVNLTKTPVVAEDIFTGLNNPRGIAIYNNFIYISAKTQVIKYPLPCVNADKPIVTKSGNTLSTTMVSGLRYQWVDCSDNSPITNATTNTYTPTVSGTYAVQITSSGGCKEISECTMVCIANQPLVTNNSGVLSTTAVNGATYQWLDCGNSNAPISGATTNTYTATANGNYAVEITRSNGCKDTSDCATVTRLGLTESTFVSDVKLYPNPTTKDVTIELGENYNNLTVEITNFLGQVLTSKTIEKVTNRKIILPINASKGVYFISIKAKEGFARFRIIKE